MRILVAPTLRLTAVKALHSKIFVEEGSWGLSLTEHSSLENIARDFPVVSLTQSWSVAADCSASVDVPGKVQLSQVDTYFVLRGGG
ncbi:hypothetical protein SK128_015717 [Halocaridina rubra]|uniref:Uncharacterized protein n=1 Tax=Halocaridina rubra TaxID=373956 RepID=A0AAN8XP73_HALRR